MPTNNIYAILKILLVLVGFSSLCTAQQILVQGKITDSLHNPLPYANILAVPQAEDLDVKFAFTNQKIYGFILMEILNPNPKMLKLKLYKPTNYGKTVI